MIRIDPAFQHVAELIRLHVHALRERSQPAEIVDPLPNSADVEQDGADCHAQRLVAATSWCSSSRKRHFFVGAGPALFRREDVATYCRRVIAQKVQQRQLLSLHLRLVIGLGQLRIRHRTAGVR